MALDLFAKQGYSETTVDQIVSATGVTKGAFYYYFKSKDQVLELLHDQFLEYEMSMAEQVRKSSGNPREKLRLMVHDLIQSIVIYRKNVVVFFQEVDRLPPERRAQIEERRRVYQTQIEDLIRSGIELGVFHRDLDPVITTLGIFGLCNYTYRWLDPNGRLSVTEVADRLASLLLDGMAGTNEVARELQS